MNSMMGDIGGDGITDRRIATLDIAEQKSRDVFF